MIVGGKYEVIGELGRGGMGLVYQVRHLELGAIFALKMLRSNLPEEADVVGRFHREARVIAQLRHPHIVKVFDIGQDGDRPEERKPRLEPAAQPEERKPPFDPARKLEEALRRGKTP